MFNMFGSVPSFKVVSKVMKIGSLGLVGVLSISLSFSVINVSAQATSKDIKVNKKSEQSVMQILQKIKGKDPQKLESKKLTKNFKNQNELNSDQTDLQVKFSLNDKKVKISNKNKGDITINIPNSQQFDSVDVVDDKVVYSGQNSKTDVIVESIDGGVRQVINIKLSDAPNFYDFPVDLGIGDKLELSENGQAVIKNSKQETKIVIATPWAKDANNKDLKTWYTVVNGNALRQNIDLKGAVFPVVADPTWCGSVINSTQWVYRKIYGNKYNWSLEVKPTDCGKNFARFNHDASWEEMYAKTSSWGYIGYNIYYVWNKSTNYWSMRNQLYCHTDWVQVANLVAPFTQNQYRDTYNLETWRDDKGYWGFVWSQCN